MWVWSWHTLLFEPLTNKKGKERLTKYCSAIQQWDKIIRERDWQSSLLFKSPQNGRGVPEGNAYGWLGGRVERTSCEVMASPGPGHSRGRGSNYPSSQQSCAELHCFGGWKTSTPSVPLGNRPTPRLTQGPGGARLRSSWLCLCPFLNPCNNNSFLKSKHPCLVSYRIDPQERTEKTRTKSNKTCLGTVFCFHLFSTAFSLAVQWYQKESSDFLVILIRSGKFPAPSESEALGNIYNFPSTYTKS